jgi:hypothetical protein
MEDLMRIKCIIVPLNLTSKKAISFLLNIVAVLAISLMLIPTAFATDSTNIVGTWHFDERAQSRIPPETAH